MIKNIDLKPILIREQVIKTCRAFFDQQHFHEVMIPVLNEAVPHEATLFPFSTIWHNTQADQKLFMTLSPESALKKMLAAGIGDCYGIGKCFRNLEAAGATHNPEFLMLEWYRLGVSMEKIMADVEELLSKLLLQLTAASYAQPTLKLNRPWLRLSLDSLLQKQLGVTIADILTDEAMIQFAQKQGYQTEGANWEQLFNQLMLNEIEPHFPKEPFFLTDFPAKISPLCAPKINQPHLAQRFEFYINQIEIGNGNTENTDSAQVQQTFQTVQAQRAQTGQETSPVDTEFIEALRTLEGKKMAGIGVGIDRLAMLFSEQTEIGAVEPFVIPFTFNAE